MSPDLIDRIAATIRRVDGNHTMGAGALAEAIVEDCESDLTAKLAAQREGIAQAIEARAQRIRGESWEESTGVALAAVVNEDARIAREYGEKG